MQREGEVGLYARPQPSLLRGRRVESGEEARLRALPFAAAVVHVAQLVLDRRERRRLALGGGAFVARQSAAVVAEQGAHVADALMQFAGVRVAQGERRLEMLERVGVSVQRRGMLRGEAVAARLRPRDRPPGAGAQRRGPRSPRPAAASTARPPRARGAGGAVRGSSARRRARGASGARSRRWAPVPGLPARRPAPRAPRAHPRFPRRCVRSPAAPCPGRRTGRWPPPRRAPGAPRRRVPQSRVEHAPHLAWAATPRPGRLPRAEPRGTRQRTAAGPRSLHIRAARGRALRRPGRAACTSVATSPSSSRAGLTIAALPSRTRSTARRRSR